MIIIHSLNDRYPRPLRSPSKHRRPPGLTMSGMRSHDYRSHIVWDGNLGDGTASYATYGRQYRVVVAGKPDLNGSANPVFRGDAGKHDPEDLFLAAIAACHMLSYLALCARDGIRVVAYDDDASGTLVLDASGGGRF